MMNTEYSAEWIRPPKELFSRKWGYIVWGDNNSRPPLYGRIDETKKKLENLEKGLRIKRRGDNNPGYVQDLLIDTVTLLNSYIGVWESTKPTSGVPPHVTMIYPHASRVMSNWEEIVLGGVQREGVCLSMLSPQSVEWLNRLCHWVSE